MLDMQKAQDYYGFAGGWRPQRVGGEPEEAAPGPGRDDSAQLQAGGDPQLACRASSEHLEELFEEPSRLGGEEDPWLAQASREEATRAESLAPLIAVVGGSGGVGRSSVAVLCAALAASQGIDTALIEGDLQFGDYGFWFGLDDNLPNLGDPRACPPVECAPGFSLYKAPLFPEVAEEVEDLLAEEVPRMRRGRELVIADTGGMWSGYTASLLLQCDLYLMVVDQRPSSVASALKACELCHRLKVPRTRMVVVFNRWSSKAALSAREVGRALDATHVCCIQDSKEPLDELLRCGGIEELLSSDNPAVNGARELLRQALPRVGCSFESADARRKGLFK